MTTAVEGRVRVTPDDNRLNPRMQSYSRAKSISHFSIVRSQTIGEPNAQSEDASSIQVCQISELGEGIRVLAPLNAVVECRGRRNYIASVDDLLAFASGDSVEEAVENLQETLVYLAHNLASREDEALGKRARKQKQRMLRSIVVS